MNYFVINGHKYYSYAQGRLNKTLFDEIIRLLKEDGNEVKTTVVEHGYNVEEETEKFKWADTVIFQTPMNWFSVPWILKKYFDEIYQYGVFYEGSEEYGHGGLMKGKRYMYSMTCNPAPEDYEEPNGFFEGNSLEHFIIALHKLQQYVGFEPIKTFCVYDVISKPDIVKYLKQLNNHINTYVLHKYL